VNEQFLAQACDGRKIAWIWLYIIVADLQSLPVVSTRSGVPFKVGISKNPKSRLDQLQTGSPMRLSLHIGDLLAGSDGREREFETTIHRRLSHLAVGGEWFFGNPDDAYEAACEVSNEWSEEEFSAWVAAGRPGAMDASK
jgi:hypothetical protein